MITTMPSTPPKTVFVFDNPRTCSQLFNKLMASHPQLSNMLHPFVGPSMYGPDNLRQHLDDSEPASTARDHLARVSGLTSETYSQATDGLMSQAAALRAQGKIPWIKDHALCVTKLEIIAAYIHHHKHDTSANPTVLPDSFFLDSTPLQAIITIRHPASILPSFYRVQGPVFHLSITDETLKVMSSLHWSRLIFDSYLSQGHHQPIVIDGADLLAHPQALISTLCHHLSLDPEGIQYTWPVVPPSQWPKDLIMRGFFQHLLLSEGVESRPRAVSTTSGGSVDLGVKEMEWEEEFGKEVARKMRLLVEDEMEDYEYLRTFCLVL